MAFEFDASTATPDGFDPSTATPDKPAGAMRKLADLGLSAAKGVIAVPEAVVGLANLATQGRAGKAVESAGIRFKDAKDVLTGFQSDDLKSKQQEFQSADGILAKAGVALSNPSLIANTVAESVPLMGAGALPARAVMAAAPRLGAVGAGAIGEGVAGAGSAGEQIRQETTDGLLTGKQAALGAATGVATGVFGAVGGKLANRLGIGDVDTMLAKGSLGVAQSAKPTGLVGRVAGGAFSEGVLEELPQSVSEQALQNVALDRPVTQGLEDAAVMGTLAGGVMGAGAGALTRQPSIPTTDPIAEPEAPATPTRSQAMGINPAAGPISAAAAMAVDSGAHDLEIAKQAAALSEQSQDIQLEQANAADQAAYEDAKTASAEAPSADELFPLAPAKAEHVFSPYVDANGDIVGIDQQPFPTLREALIQRNFENKAAGSKDFDTVPVGDGRFVVRRMRYPESSNVQPDAVQPLPSADSGAGRADGVPSVVSGDPDGLERAAEPSGPAADSVVQPGELPNRVDAKPLSAKTNPQPTTLGTQTNVKAGPGFSVKDALPVSKIAATQPDITDKPTDSTPNAPDLKAEAPKSEPVQGNSAATAAPSPASLGSKKADMEHLFGIPEKRTKAIARIAKGTAYFSNRLKAGNFIAESGLKETHEVVKHESGANRWDVRAKVSSTKENVNGPQAEKPQQIPPRQQDAGQPAAIDQPAATAPVADAGQTASTPAPVARAGLARMRAAKAAKEPITIAPTTPASNQVGPKPAAQATQDGEYTLVGRNKDGKTIMQDKRGVRSISDNGVRVEESVQMRPARQGMQLSVEHKGEFLTVEEIAKDAQDNEDGMFQSKADKASIEQKPTTVTVPPTVSESFTAQMQKQKGRITRLTNEAAKAGSLADKRAAQLKVTAAEATLRQMRLKIFEAEDAAVKAVEGGGVKAFSDFADLFPDAANEIAKLSGQNDELDAETRSYEAKANPTYDGKPAPISNVIKAAQDSGKLQIINVGDKPAVKANTLFTEDAAAAARARLKAKLGRLSSGIDPETMMDGITLAGYHIEKGARTFAAYAKAMIDDLGDGVKPYLKSWYMGVKYDPKATGFDGMDSAATVESADVETVGLEKAVEKADTVIEDTENAARKLDSTGARSLAGAQAPDVRAPDGQRDAGESADGRSRSNSVGDSKPDGAGRDLAGSVGADAGVVPVPAGRTKPDAQNARKPRVSRKGGTESGNGLFGAAGGLTPDTGANPAPNAPSIAAPQPAAEDFTITDELTLGEGGQKTKFKNNIAAIKLVRELESTGRMATPDEQKVLAKYVGWGGIAQAFDANNADWSKEYAEITSLMSDDDLASARQSTRYAHYTSREIIVDGIYAAMRQFGFTGGKTLEAGAGVGNFIGMMPADMRSAGRFTAIEREPFSSAIARQLYPQQNVQRADFTEFKGTDSYFDAAVGNPPFASDPQTDRSGRKHLSGLSLHNYFFAKSIDMLREGGIMAQVVTNSFMDAKGDRARKYMSDRVELLGAIRLPNSAFTKNANTEVTTDIIFLKKRPDSEVGGKAAREDAKRWLDTGVYTDKNGKKVALNQYFIDNPSMMLGDYGAFGTMYGPDQPALVAKSGQDTLALLKQAVGKLPAGVYKSIADTGTDNQVAATILALKNPSVKEGGYFVEGDKLIQRLPDIAGEARGTEITPETQWTEKTKLGEPGFERIKALAGLRSTVRGLLAAEMSDNALGMKVLRATLNKQYDNYRDTHGLLNDPGTLRVFDDDPDFPLLASLEHGYAPGIGLSAAKRLGVKPAASTAKKGPIFSQRVVAARQTVQKVETPADALAVSMAERGKLDAAYIGTLLGMEPEAVLKELSTGDKPLLFRDPATDEFVLRDAYLSGNVRAKLAQARQAGMFTNINALEAVQPEDVGSHEITARLGSPWVPTEVYKEFAKSLYGEESRAVVVYLPLNSSFQVFVNGGSEVAMSNTWGTPNYPGDALLQALMNNRTIKVTYVDADKKTRTDIDATEKANTKAQEIKEKFNDWLFSDPERSELLTKAYNETNNNYVTRVYDGSNMNFPGKVPDSIIKFRRHQRNAIARIVQDRTALLDHVVGAGKTFTVISGAMELKRTGLARKPMVAVPNHLVKQWAADFYRLYPGANVLTATKKDFEKANRRKFLARIATGDWDAVVIAHSSYGFIKPSPEFEAEFNGREIQKIMTTIQAVEAEDGDKQTKKRTVKQLEGMKERLENRIKALRDKPMDDLLDFEQIGVDQLFVDEAHMFKNLMYTTKMQGVAGLNDPTGSQRSYDMYVKTNQVMEKNGRGQGVVFATGTPVSNSLAEMYHMMRYLMPNQMRALGFESFDAWANTYASVEQVWMQSPSGDGFKAQNRMSNFVNTPELLKMFDQVSDTVTMDDIKKAYSEENNGDEFPLPKLKGGRRTPVSLEKSPAQNAYMDEIATRAKLIEQRKGPPQKGDDNILVVMSDARKAAMDIRLVDPDITTREPGGRIDRATDEAVARYQQYNSVKGTQLVFSDLGTPLKHAKKELKEYEALRARVESGDEDTATSATLGNEAAMETMEDSQAAQAELDAMGPDWLSAVKAALRGFSVYDDFKAALIEKGIPEAEIAFIHDYNTDDQKAALFRKVNAGQIRVLLGSTAKLGAGTNVQERLVAEHHLDVPWRPSDVEQREGRIERQGNVLMKEWPNFEIEILAYVTRDTLDMRMWQVQETKLKMINQLRTRKIGREIDNAFEDMELSAGEMQAAATGDINLLKEIQLRNDVKKLEQRRRSFDGQRNDLIARKRRNAEQLRELPKKLKDAEAESVFAEQYKSDLYANVPPFKMNIDGKDYTDAKEAQEYLRTKDEATVESTDLAGEVTTKKAPLSVTIDGELIKNRATMAELFANARGDVNLIMWEVNGQTYRRRTVLANAMRQNVLNALADENVQQVGTIGAYSVAVEGSTEKGGNVVLEVTMRRGGEVKLSNSMYISDTGAAPGRVVDQAENLMESAINEANYLERALQRAQKDATELNKVEVAGDWPEQSKLDAAREAHKAILAKLKEKGTKPAIDYSQPNVKQTGAFEANDTDVVFGVAEPVPGAYTDKNGTGTTPTASPTSLVRGNSEALRGRITGLAIADKIRTEGAQALVGQIAATSADLASLAQVYRDPRYETFRLFLTKGDQIVHATGVSARLPGQSPMVPKGMTPKAYYQLVRDEMARTGADGYYMLHNHPSGDPTPSNMDIGATKELAAQVSGMRAHVVINSNQFAVIDTQNQSSTYYKKFGDDDLLKASIPSPYLGRDISDPKSLALLAKGMQKSGWVTLIGTGSKNEVRLMFDAPVSNLTRSYMSLAGQVRALMRKSGSGAISLVGTDADVASQPVQRALREGILRDAVGESGQTQAALGTGGRQDAFTNTRGRFVAEEDAPSYVRSIKDTLNTAANSVKDVKLPAGYLVGDLINSAPGKLNWWHKTIGTQYNLAQRSAPFKRVFDSVQNFINDVSFYATEAADLAPNILPKLETWKDITKAPLSAQDTKAISAPIFEGTLTWARDESGKPIKMAELEAQAAKLTTEQKAQRLMRNKHITGQVLKMWQGLPIEQFESIINDKYERDMLKAGVVWTPAELKAMFGLTDKQVSLYQEFRTATDKSLTNLAVSDMLRFGGDDVAVVRDQAMNAATPDAAANILADHLREMAELIPERNDLLLDTADRMIEKGDRATDLMARGYAPLSRFGQYTLDVVHDGERVYFGMFENKVDAARMARDMTKQFPGAQVTRGTVSEQAYKMFAGVSPETLELFGNMLGLEAGGDAASAQAFQTYLKLAKSNRSSMKRLIERKGIAGFNEDSGRVLAGFVYSNARQTASNLHIGEMTQAAADNKAFGRNGELQDAAVKLVDYIKNPQEEAQAVRGLLFAQYIGGSIASAMVNLTQPLTMTFPWLSQYGGVTKAAKQMAAATKDALKKRTGDKDLDAALRRAEEDGTVSPQEVHQLMAQSMGKGGLRSGDGTKAGDALALAQNSLSRVSLAWGKLFSVAEQFNRRSTFIAAYRTAVAEGMADPDGFARKAIAETQGIYNKGNKPAWARGAIGGTLFTFKQFSISYMEMLSRMAKNGPEGKKAALLALAVLFLMSGAGGAPGADDLDDLISGALQSMGYNFDSKVKRREFFASIVGEGGALFLERGLSGLPGAPIDVSGRMGMGNLIPGTGLFTKKTDHTRDVAEIAGPAGDLFKRAFTAAGELIKGEAVSAVTTISPTAIQNLTKAYDMANMGMYRDQSGKKVIDTDASDAVAKAIGFQPNDVKKVQDAGREVQRMIGLNKMRETEIADKWAKGLFEKDPPKVQEARDELAQWNADNPESPIRISFGQVIKRLKAMNQTKEERLIKTAPKEIRNTVRQELMAAR